MSFGRPGEPLWVSMKTFASLRRFWGVFLRLYENLGVLGCLYENLGVIGPHWASWGIFGVSFGRLGEPYCVSMKTVASF